MKIIAIASILLFMLVTISPAMESSFTADFGVALPMGKMAGEYGPPNYGWNQDKGFFLSVLFNFGILNHLSIQGGAFYSLNHIYKGEWSDPQYVIPYSRVFLIITGARLSLMPDAKYNIYFDGGGGMGSISYNIADNWGEVLSRRYYDPAVYVGAGLEISATDTLSVDIPVHYAMVFWKPYGDEEFMPGWPATKISLLYLGGGITYWAF